MNKGINSKYELNKNNSAKSGILHRIKQENLNYIV